jgi:DNA modification methylase
VNLGTAQVIRANARYLPLADNSVDLVVTSPPYFALRSYQDGGEHYEGQIGDEPTPAEFVDSLLEVTRECVRVLKPSGSLWVNLGDKYAGSRMDGSTDNGGTGSSIGANQVRDDLARQGQGVKRASGNVRQKSLIGIPWRYALRCIDDLGLILRAEVIWSKPNGLPESVTDRVRRSHEQWFHFTLEPRYFSAVDEIREQYEADSAARRIKYGQADCGGGYATGDRNDASRGGPMGFADANNANPLGKLPGSVWTVPTEPLRVPDHLGVDHFAAFPTEWPKRIIQGWSPAGVCMACGEGRRPVATVTPVESKPFAIQQHERSPLSGGTRNQGLGYSAAERDRTISGYACACPEPTADTTPAVVLDPFGGTGTTAMVAKALGRHGISVDMSADYCRLAEWRTNDRDQLAKVLGVAKAEQQPDDQPSLWEEPA